MIIFNIIIAVIIISLLSYGIYNLGFVGGRNFCIESMYDYLKKIQNEDRDKEILIINDMIGEVFLDIKKEK